METSVFPTFIFPWRLDLDVTSAQTSIHSRPAASAISASSLESPPFPVYPSRVSAMESSICSL